MRRDKHENSRILQNSKNGRRVCLVILIVLISAIGISGCFSSISVQKYPDNWPAFPSIPSFLAATRPEDVCCLTGTYAEMGESPSGHPFSLSQILFGYIRSGTTLVTFEGPHNGYLQISSWSDNTLIETLKLSELKVGFWVFSGSQRDGHPYGQYICLRSGAVALFPPGYEPGSSYTRETYLFRAHDGSLMFKVVNFEVGFIFIPVGFQFEVSWYRFPPASQAEDVQ
jgi:hypothetical protein